MKKLSIMIAVFNQEELVVRALDSIPRRNDIEVICVDDGSTDNSYVVLQRYQQEHPELDMNIIHQENKGLGAVKNLCYSIFNGEYFYQLDNDDYLYTKEFEKAMEYLDGTDMVYVDLRINDGRILALNEKSKNTLVAGTTRFIRRGFLGEHRTREDIWDEDLYFNNLLQKIPHTEKFTGLIVYHYNFPRVGSMFWNAVKGKT